MLPRGIQKTLPSDEEQFSKTCQDYSNQFRQPKSDAPVKFYTSLVQAPRSLQNLSALEPPKAVPKPSLFALIILNSADPNENVILRIR